MLMGRPAMKMISPVARIAQKALVKPYFTSSVAPTASRIKNDAAPKAALETAIQTRCENAAV